MMYKGTTRSPGVVVLLSIITCGIYAIYWFYCTMQDVNGILGREKIPMWVFLVSIFVPPVWLYFLYLTEEGMAEFCAMRSRNYEKKFIIWLILTLVCGIGELVAMVQIQGQLNEFWAS